MQTNALTVRDLQLLAGDGKKVRSILDIPSLTLPPGALIGVSGASGSGKTSLLRVISGLAVPRTGSVCWNGTDITRLPEYQRDAWRGQHIGFVFQDFRLFPTLSALDNVLVPSTFRRLRTPPGVRERAFALLLRMGIEHPGQQAHTLSRGEQQRVAVARALLPQPGIVLADEPTASLDAENARIVMDALFAYAATASASLCLVSHDPDELHRTHIRLRLERGRLMEQTGV